MIPVSELFTIAKYGLEIALGGALIALGYQLGCMREKSKDPNKKVFVIKYRGTLEEIRKMREIMK